MKSSMSLQQSNTKKGFVKQVLSGDSVVFQFSVDSGSPPTEITVYLYNVIAPKLAKHPTQNSEATMDEPYAWEAREFIRLKLVGKTVTFVREYIATSGREYGHIYIDAENISESGVSFGLLKTRNRRLNDEFTKKLLNLQQNAINGKKGKFSGDESSKHVRNIQWILGAPSSLVTKYGGNPVDAVIEEVISGSTFRAFLLPSFEYITISLSGIEAPRLTIGNEVKPEEYGEEAKHYVEIRLLQRDVKIILESTANQNFIASVLHPRGDIAEFLLKEGLAKCDDQTIGLMTGDREPKLREAESNAKQELIRIWKRPALQVSTSSSNKNSSAIDDPRSGGVNVHTTGGNHAHDSDGGKDGRRDRGSGGGSKCYNCGESGHYAHNCNGGGGKGVVQCYTCKKYGHMFSECYENVDITSFRGSLDSGCDHVEEIQPVKLIDVSKTNEKSLDESPQSLLNEAVFRYKQKKGGLVSDLCWKSSSLMLKRLMNNNGLEPCSHKMQNQAIFYIRTCLNPFLSLKLRSVWMDLQVAHSNSYSNTYVELKDIYLFLMASEVCSNILYHVHENNLFNAEQFLQCLSYDMYKEIKQERNGEWKLLCDWYQYNKENM